MKKFLIKVGIFTILSTFTSILVVSNATFATELIDALDDVTPCIDETGEDKGKIVTVIEEPLSSTQEPIGDTIFRPCWRHTFQYTITEGEGDDKTVKSKTLSVLGRTKCKALGYAAGFPEEAQPKYSCKEVQAVISKGGTSLIYSYIGMIYRWGASMVGIVAVLIIVISGIQISAAGGDQEAVTKAKTRILQSLAGIAVLFLSGLILYTINPTFFTY